MDVSLTWASIQNKPSSAVADIDESVTNRMVADTTNGRTNNIKPNGTKKFIVNI